ncbi:MAG: excalibur calcium-binding domain-containing protein [Actinomycetota bacterium]|nr:excalibur calcium-binding domain-containing protein [Actinomycetota bacterium]
MYPQPESDLRRRTRPRQRRCRLRALQWLLRLGWLLLRQVRFQRLQWSTYYANCSAARAAGAASLHQGDQGYRSGLDRDNDGLACE